MIRKQIIDRIKDAKAIVYILNYGEKRITEKCEKQPDFGNGLIYYRIDLLNKSFAGLMKEKLQQLQKEKEVWSNINEGDSIFKADGEITVTIVRGGVRKVMEIRCLDVR